MSVDSIPDEYWDSSRKRYDSHSFFKTINHSHISNYGGNESCDIMIVECADGRWFIEDNWGGDAKGAPDVFNPFIKGAYPTFFESCEKANYRAAEVVSSITGADIQDLLLDDEDDE